MWQGGQACKGEVLGALLDAAAQLCLRANPQIKLMCMCRARQAAARQQRAQQERRGRARARRACGRTPSRGRSAAACWSRTRCCSARSRPTSIRCMLSLTLNLPKLETEPAGSAPAAISQPADLLLPSALRRARSQYAVPPPLPQSPQLMECISGAAKLEFPPPVERGLAPQGQAVCWMRGRR